MTELSNWKQGYLGEECSIEIGGTPSRDKAEYWSDPEEGHPWVSIKDMNQRTICRTSEYITDLGVSHSNVKLQSPGTVLLSFKLTIGRVAFAGLPLYTNEAIAGLRSNSMSPDFIYYGLQQWNLLQGVDQAIKGATLNKKKLKQIEISYPILKCEQIKIAGILTTVDCAVEQAEALIAKQRRIRAGLMQDLLTRGIDKNGNLRSESTHLFTDSPVGRIPVEWEVRPLAAIVEIIDCKHYTPAYAAEGIPIIRPRNIKDYGLDMCDIDFVTEKDYALLTDKHEPIDGDIVFSRNASFGIPVYVEGVGRFCIGQDVVVMSRRNADTRYVYSYLKSNKVVSQIAIASAGSTFGRIDLEAIRNLKIALPKTESEQCDIAKRLLLADRQEGETKAELKKLRALKTALMQELLTGKKRVTPLLELDNAF